MKRLTYIILAALVWTTATQAARIDTLNIYSKAMDKDIATVVVMPTAGGDARYPVVYLLHGAFGNQYSWLHIKPDLPRIADDNGLVFVMPGVGNSWYFDSPLHKDVCYETFMSDELIAYTDTHYPTMADRRCRAIAGLSMGGHGALFAAMRHKEVFGAAGSMSGGVDFRPFPENWNIKEELGEMATNKQRWDEMVVVNQINRIENGDLAIIFDCGEQDFFLEVNKSLHERLLGRGIDHDFTMRPGGHDSHYWNNALDYQLLFFIKYFKREET